MGIVDELAGEREDESRVLLLGLREVIDGVAAGRTARRVDDEAVKVNFITSRQPPEP